MTEEDKRLLLIDLCARIPYGVKVIQGNVLIENLYSITRIGYTDYSTNRMDDVIHGFNIEEVKPYLRPISSMTDSEMDMLFDILGIDKSGEAESWIKINGVTGIKFFIPEGVWVEDMAKVYDYLNSIHIDYRGLIDKGLALEAEKDMY